MTSPTSAPYSGDRWRKYQYLARLDSKEQNKHPPHHSAILRISHVTHTNSKSNSGILFIQYITDTSRGLQVLYPSPFPLNIMSAMKHASQCSMTYSFHEDADW